MYFSQDIQLKSPILKQHQQLKFQLLQVSNLLLIGIPPRLTNIFQVLNSMMIMIIRLVRFLGPLICARCVNSPPLFIIRTNSFSLKFKKFIFGFLIQDCLTSFVSFSFSMNDYYYHHHHFGFVLQFRLITKFHVLLNLIMLSL